jgi:hypothetical protein
MNEEEEEKFEEEEEKFEEEEEYPSRYKDDIWYVCRRCNMRKLR